MNNWVPKNINEPILQVKHDDLERASEDSAFKSKCPVCLDGVLLMQRNQKTLELLDVDRCVSCGQAFRYSDFAEKFGKKQYVGPEPPELCKSRHRIK